ncbi:DNRLRE domain-containing protein [Effusibacillus consociatus]|uniref:DNRLRE domain-containing protein n=1 Tax=Effusibacillus consociatus TaxID=1117041 RepID=A0ABV9PWR7_9BACL
MGKFGLRSLVIPILSLGLILSPIPGLSKATKAGEADSPVTVPKTVQEPKKDVSFSLPREGPQELEQFRTATSKRFLNPDGSLTEKIYMEPVHYKDTSTGKWLPIDSNLALNLNGTYKNKANKFTVDLPPVANAGFFRFAENGTALSFRPTFGIAVKGSVKDNQIGYVNVVSDTDLYYAVVPNGLKETIILKSSKAPTTFSYELKMENLTYQPQKDGTVAFYKTGEKEPLFVLQKPFLVDSKQSSTTASYQFRTDASGNTVLDLVVDPTWMQDPNRAYPIELDPTIVTKDSPKVDDTLVSSSNPYSNYGNWSHVYVGESVNLGTTRSLFWFNLPSIPSGAVISSANLTVSNTTVYVTNQAPVVEARRITQDWTGNSVTWSNQPTVGGVDGSYTASNTTTPANWDIPITGLVREWYNGTQANYGVELKYANEALVVRELLATDDPNTPANHPYLSVTYTVDGLGKQPFWTFDGSVNMGNRNLVLSATDISFPGRRVAVPLKRTYNSRSSYEGPFGYGWNSVIDLRLNVPVGGPARLIDGDRTVHYFAQNLDGSYTSPPGLFWNLSVSGTTATVITTDYTQYTFEISTGKPKEIKDAAGNALTFSYNASGQVTSIQDAAAHAISLTYNASGKVDSATDPTGRKWLYGYDSNGNLIKVTAPDGTAVQYRYDSNRNLIASVSPKGNATYFAYTSDDRVAAINPTNAVTNSNFEVDADGDGLPDHFSLGGGQSGQASFDATSGSNYGQAFKINTSSANPSNYTVFVSDPIPADPSRTYTLSGYLKATQTSGSLNTVLSLLAYDANGTQLGEVGRTAIAGPSDWQRVSQTMTPGTATALPAGTTTVYVKVAGSSSNGSGISWFDAVQLEEAASATDFVSGSQYTANPPTMQSASYDGEGRKNLYTYNDNQNVTKSQQDPSGLNLTDTFTWDPNIPNTLSSHQDPRLNTWSFSYDANSGNLVQVTDPKSGKQSFQWDGKSNLTQYTGVNGGTYKNTYDNGSNNLTARDPYSTSQALENDSYGNVVKETNLLGWADNLIDNSSFEGSVQANGLPNRFAYDGGQQNTWSLSTDPVFGNQSLNLSASSTNAQTYTVIISDPVTADTSADYVLSGYVKATQTSGTQSTVLSVLAYNITGGQLGEVGRMNPQGTANWQRWSTVIRAADFPAGTATIRVKLAVSNGTGTGNSSFDAVQLQKTPVDTAYNLADNSSFERGSTWPDNWSTSSLGTNTWEISPNVYAGGRAVSIANATNWSGITYGNFIPYDSTKTYNLTAFVKTAGLSAQVAHIKIEEYDTNKALIGQAASQSLTGTNDWQRLSAELVAGSAVAGTKYIRPVLMTGNATGTVYFDNVRLQEERVTTEYTYDTSNTWVTSKKNPLGETTSYQHDAAGNVKQETDPMGDIKQFSYDSMNRLSLVIPPGNDVKALYSYDLNGNLETIKFTNLSESVTFNQTKISYNSLDQPTSLTDPLGRQTTYSYTPSGRLKEILTATNNRLSFAYDKVNRLTDVSFNGSGRYQYGYDANSNVTSAKDLAQNRTWTATYNELNQATSWKDDGTATISYTLDGAGNVTQKQLKNNTTGTVLKTESLTYNKVDQTNALTDADGKVSKFLYNENKQLSVLQSGNDISQRFSYNSASRVTQVRNQTKTGQILSTFLYGYNPNGLITTIQDQTGQTLSYTYTVKGQLESETLPSGNIVTYRYDPLGNRTERQEKQPNGTIVKTTNYTYDAANQLVTVDGSKPWTYDQNGNLTWNGVYNFKWDAANRLVEVDDAAGGVIATYQYDDKGRRVQQTVNGQVTKFLYDGKSNRVLAEFDGAGNLTKYYTWSPTGQLLSLTVNGTTYYTVRNAHGDIVQLTDGNGNVVASYTYDAWGNLLSQSGTAASFNPYRYAGYRYDDTTGLYYLMARYYDPSVSRFLSVDPEFVEPDYTYAGNNPLSFVDPSGRSLIDLGFLVYDTWNFIQNPTWENAAWMAFDVVMMVVEPTGAANILARTARAVDIGAHAVEGARVVGEADRIAAKGAGAISKGAHAGDGVAAVAHESTGIIYKRTDLKTGGTYIGQAKSEARYKQRQKEHARNNPNARYVFEELGRAKPGKDLNVLEQKMINKFGGIQRGGEILENKRNQIRRSNWSKFGIE